MALNIDNGVNPYTTTLAVKMNKLAKKIISML